MALIIRVKTEHLIRSPHLEEDTQKMTRLFPASMFPDVYHIHKPSQDRPAKRCQSVVLEPSLKLALTLNTGLDVYRCLLGICPLLCAYAELESSSTACEPLGPVWMAWINDRRSVAHAPVPQGPNDDATHSQEIVSV